MKPTQITLAIVGVDYPNRTGPTRRFGLQLLQPGDPVELRPEPDNPKDPQAIAVYTRCGIQIGYLPAERVPFIHMQWMRGWVSAIFQGHTPYGGAARIAFDGDTPTLPPARMEPKEEQTWWPDPEYPDD